MTAIKSKQANEITHINALNLYGNTRIQPYGIQTGRPDSVGHGSLYSILPGIKNNQPCAERIQQEMRIMGRTHPKMGV